MKPAHWFGLLVLSAPLLLAGCTGGAPNPPRGSADTGADVRGKADSANQKGDTAGEANLAKLSPDDRRLAEAQGRCPVSGEPLGSMGTPPKVLVKDQPVFLCCGMCEKKALADPDQTLAKVKDLKAKSAPPQQ